METLYCEGCNEDAVTAVKTAELVKTKCMQYVAELREELLEYTEEKRMEMKKEIDQELHDIREDLKSVKESVQASNVSENAEKNLKELELREKKKLNVVFFNVEEGNSSTKEEAIKEDQENLERIQEVLKTTAKFSDITRLGGRSPERPRPLKGKTGGSW